jgi:hypothetical protein
MRNVVTEVTTPGQAGSFLDRWVRFDKHLFPLFARWW